MAQHFLLSAKARTLSIRKIATLTDEQVVCPKCQVRHQAYWSASRRQWRCKQAGCRHTFSVTSGTIFANHKLPLKVYLLAIAFFVNAVKGLSALQLSRELSVQYKTAFVLAQKLRQALLDHRQLKTLSGKVDMDGTYIHPAPRKANRKADRIDYRLKANQNPNKRCVMVAREHYTEQEKATNTQYRGAKHSHVFVTYAETQSVIKRFADQFIAKGTTVQTDESYAYHVLMPFYNLCTVNHKNEYRSDKGITNNQAESYFSRFKRMYFGQVHKMSNLYLLGYANESAYREDHRREPNGWLFQDILRKCLTTTNRLNYWCQYWQRKIMPTERLWT